MRVNATIVMADMPSDFGVEHRTPCHLFADMAMKVNHSYPVPYLLISSATFAIARNRDTCSGYIDAHKTLSPSFRSGMDDRVFTGLHGC